MKGKPSSAAAEKAGFSDSNYYSMVFAKVKRLQSQGISETPVTPWTA
ncbi:MAG: hypothetical protein ACLTER_16675 [Ruminococcus sp.]